MTTSRANSAKGTGRSTRPVSAMPEALTRRDRDAGPWTVSEGLPIRGDASTNVETRTMRVPFGTSSEARTIRAHEMVHAKVSPSNLDEILPVMGINEGTIRAVEEIRVNLLALSAGFDLDHLRDGSERTLGRRLAETKSVRPLVEMAVGTMFTKAHDDLVRGVQDHDPALADQLRAFVDVVESHIVEQARRWYLRGRLGKRNKGKRLGDALRIPFASTAPVIIGADLGGTGEDEPTPGESVEVPKGFTYTLKLARMIDDLLDAGPNGEGETLPPPGPVTRPGDGSGDWWAPLKWDRDVALNRWAPNLHGRRRARSSTGRVPRRVDLLLTDPERRIFSRDVRSTGGVVIIDQSGSMSLSMSDVEALVDASAGCVVIGYSNGRRGGPNAWVLADRGRVASQLREGNVGNGCDRPVLDHALSIRRGNEPVIWVCDGMVTFASDGFATKSERARILADVATHRVHMVDTVEEAVDALRLARSTRLPARYTAGLVPDFTDDEIRDLFGGVR